MIDIRMLERELRQARQARIEAQAAGCDIEEMREQMRRPFAVWPRLAGLASGPPQGHGGPASQAA